MKRKTYLVERKSLRPKRKRIIIGGKKYWVYQTPKGSKPKRFTVINNNLEL